MIKTATAPTIRPLQSHEIDSVASLISAGYFDDAFFAWAVDDENDRMQIVAEYYKVYMRYSGCVAYIAENGGEIAGAAIWLPHDTSAQVYHEISSVTGKYAPQFDAVSDMSHQSEPPLAPFYQLVGFVVDKQAQGHGIGSALMAHSLATFDGMGIPTYLEASTPYYGGGVYGKFGYQPVGELMHFAKNAVLYPLWRHAAPPLRQIGGYTWRELCRRGQDTLLIMQDTIITHRYHNKFEAVDWHGSDICSYLNNSFYDRIGSGVHVLRTQIGPATSRIFLLSIGEVLKYFGGSMGVGPFYVDDAHNKMRTATSVCGKPCRWLLRTPGNTPGFTAVVTTSGTICTSGDFVNRGTTSLAAVGVRPAMWVRGL